MCPSVISIANIINVHGIFTLFCSCSFAYVHYMTACIVAVVASTLIYDDMYVLSFVSSCACLHHALGMCADLGCDSGGG